MSSRESTVLGVALDIRIIPLTALRESSTNPRKHFDEKKLGELAASIRDRGVLEPILVRPVDGAFEVVAGARRFRASKDAGKADIPAIVREYSDEEAFEVQIEENDQRDDLAPLDRAEAYAALAARGKSAAEIAAIVKRRTPEVASTLALATLPKRVKDAVASGLLPVPHAALIARIPDATLQEQALGRILRDFGDEKPVVAAMPLKLARQVVEEEFMAPLSAAAFDPEDASLSALGACSTCPHLASNNRDLFGDVKRKAVCTNPKDFRVKTENHLRRMKENGHSVLLSKKEVRRAFPVEGNPHHLAKEFVDLERICADDPRRRTYETLLSRAAKLKTVYVMVDHQVRRLYPSAALVDALVTSGHAFAKPKRRLRGDGTKGTERDSTGKADRIVRDAVARELAKCLASARVSAHDWVDLFLRTVALAEGWKLGVVIRRHGFKGTAEEFAEQREAVLVNLLTGMTDGQKRALTLDLLISDWDTKQADEDRQHLYRDVLKLAGVDPVAIGKRALDEAKLARAGAQRVESAVPAGSAKPSRSTAPPAKAVG
jgi:ParB family chromosome partitioning protein